MKREVKVMGESKILGQRQGKGLVGVRIRVLMEVVLLLKVADVVKVFVLVVQIRPDDPSNIA